LAIFVSGGSPKSGNPYFSFSKTNSPARPEKVFVERINADSTGQNAFLVKTGLADKRCAQLQTRTQKLI
jgi:hypothetical protein